MGLVSVHRFCADEIIFSGIDTKYSNATYADVFRTIKHPSTKDNLTWAIGITMRAKLFLCADSGVIDARLTTLSAFHILDEVAAAGFPFVIPRVAIVSTLTREDHEPVNAVLQLTAQLGDDVLFQAPFRVEFQDRNFSRSIAEIGNILITAPGPLRFILKMEEVQIAEWTINIGLTANPEVYVQNAEAPPAEPPQPVANRA
jgi:hypothetical protein